MRIRLPRIADAKDHIITALVLLFAISLMISRHDGSLSNVRKASVTVLSYLEEPLANIRVFRQALNTNTYLQRQNVLLQDELSRLRSAEAQNRILRELLEFREQTDYDLVPIMVIAKELTSMNNYLTVNAGEDQQILSGMPVINSDGLVGQVTVTTNNYSQVMPFANNLFHVSARVQNSRAFGIVSWRDNRFDELVLQHIPQTIEIEPGQLVETSGYSNQYPAGIPIGEVTRVESQQGVDTQLIFLRPFVNLHTLAEGFVLKFEPDSTIQNLLSGQEELN
ncbi:MAG: rod shape-determining protein MreC [Balneolaceae bacterium]